MRGQDQIPVRYMADGMQRYIDQRVPPGSFLTALLSNDLRGCYERGDDNNIAMLQHWVRWLYNYAPRDCWGSADRVNAWLNPGVDTTEPS